MDSSSKTPLSKKKFTPVQSCVLILFGLFFLMGLCGTLAGPVEEGVVQGEQAETATTATPAPKVEVKEEEVVEPEVEEVVVEPEPVVEPKPVVAPAPEPEPAPAPVNTCDCSLTCSSIPTCDEAYRLLNECGCSARDGDGDGVPCESGPCTPYNPAPAPTPAPTPAPEPTPIPAPTPSYSCDCSKTCSAMASCEEAYYQLNTCGCSRRDGDKDGVPCESICQKGNVYSKS